jgi:hypothetical protein
MSNCNCKHCREELVVGENWTQNYKDKCIYTCLSCKKVFNDNRMWVNGKYIRQDHPLHKAGRYKSFNDAAFSSLQNYKLAKEGFVYVITNPAWPNWVKIGMAIDAEDRLNGYQTSSPMRDYQLEFSVKVSDRRKAEGLAHKICKKMGVSNKGEWFNMTVDKAKLVLEQVYG